MTREEAQIYIRDLLTGHSEDCTTNHYWDVARGVDKIYDDFESRTCENCKWFTVKPLKEDEFSFCGRMAEFLDNADSWEDTTYLEVKKEDSCTTNWEAKTVTTDTK